MAFKYICSSLFVVIAYLNILAQAYPLSYLRDNNVGQSSAFPYQNQPFVYLRDNTGNQIQSSYPLQSGPVNYINNVLSSSQIQTVGYPNTISNAGFVQYPGNGINSNFVNNINNVNNIPAQYSTVAQAVPLVNYPSVQPIAQYGVQPAIVGGVPSYGYPNQITTNTQSVPVEVNISGKGPCY